MTTAEFKEICKKFGDQTLPESERWKSIKAISVNEMDYPINFEDSFNKNMIYFLENESIGDGFYLMEYAHSDLDLFNRNKICSFIPIESVLAVSFKYNKELLGEDEQP